MVRMCICLGCQFLQHFHMIISLNSQNNCVNKLDIIITILQVMNMRFKQFPQNAVVVLSNKWQSGDLNPFLKHNALIFPKKVNALRGVLSYSLYVRFHLDTERHNSVSHLEAPKLQKLNAVKKPVSYQGLCTEKQMKSPSRRNSRKLFEWLNSDLCRSIETQVILNQTPGSEVGPSWMSLEVLTERFLAYFLETPCQVCGSSVIKAGEGYLRQGHSDAAEKISSSPADS